MWPSSSRGIQALLVACVASIALPGYSRSQTPAADPVDRLKQVLQSQGEVAERDRSTKECLEGLKTLAQLRRALSLGEWRDRNPESTYGAVDLANRAIVAERFHKTFREVFARHEATSAVIAIGMLADMAVTARKGGDSVAYLRPFTSDLTELIRNSPPKVEAAAARTLGLIEPDVSVAVPALAVLLQSTDPNLRCAAAEGLYEVLQASARMASPNGSAAAVVGKNATVQAACTILPVVGRGLADWHVEVRRRCVATVGAAAAILGKIIPEPIPSIENDGADSASHIHTEREMVRPLALALRDQGPAVTKALRDGDTEVRLLAQGALEELAAARVRWLRHGGTALSGDDPLLQGLTAALPVLGEATHDPDLRVRRAALDVLAVLGPASSPAMPALTQALSDSDRFVRWSAVRTIGAIGSPAARAALPGLTMLLEDEDLDVRKAAADAIKRLNPAASGNSPGGTRTSSNTRTALPALIRSVRAADPEMRVAAIQTLRGMGNDMKPAVPAMREALADSDARVRQAAAEALGALGPLARDAADELRTAMSDSSPDVREAAGEALLNVLRPAGQK